MQSAPPAPSAAAGAGPSTATADSPPDGGTPGDQRIAVHVQSFDSVAVAGVRALLHGHPRIHLVAEDESGTAAVVVHVSDSLGARDLHLLQAQSGRSASAVIAVTDVFADDDLLNALDAGVAGLLRRKDAGRGQLVHAVLAVADGAVLLPPRLQALLVQQLQRIRTEVLAPNGLTPSGLTARERDVLRLVADGLDTDEIASCLAFSPRTVKYVLTHLMTRYGLRSRTHAVAYAVRMGAI